MERKLKMENNSTYYIDLITRYFAGEATPDEMLALSGWIKSDPENQKLFEEYQKTWNTVEETTINSSLDIDNEWSKINSKIFSEVQEEKDIKIFKLNREADIRPNYFIRLLRVAAVFLFFAVSAYVLYYYLQSGAPKNQRLVAQLKSVESKLPDGTSVTLNAGTTLDYPEKFENDKRTVSLKGEAYFNVTHDASRPFIIAAENIRVEVLGTSFYVNTNAANGKIEVILTSGRVAVYFKDKPDERTILEPGEKAEFSKAEQKITKSENNNENYMAFKTKKLVFSDTPLSEIVETLNSIYQSNIKLKNNNIAGCRITVSFDNQSLDAILNVLKATVDLNVNKTNSGIEISGNGCK